MSRYSYCSFCGKASHRTEILIRAKDDIFICKNCVIVCNEIISEVEAGKYDKTKQDLQAIDTGGE